jgi:DNA replication protein DnaC
LSNATVVELRENLKSLTLSTIARGLDGHLRQAKEHGPGYDEFLLDLTVAELGARAESRLKRRVREAKFPLVKTMEGFDFGVVPGLDIRLVRELSGCDYIKERRNIIFLGRSGTGKTHLATAMGVEACKNNYRTRFVSCYGLVNELIEARQEKDLQRLIQRHSRYDLLILSVIITTNLGFAGWTQVFGDPVMTAALLDRLTHKAHIVNCQWESYRLKQSLKGIEQRHNEGE